MMRAGGGGDAAGERPEQPSARVHAANVISRSWRAYKLTQFSWILRGDNDNPVKLPWSPNDEPEVPAALDTPPRTDPTSPYVVDVPVQLEYAAWHARLTAAVRWVREAAERGAKAHYLAQMAYHEEVGRFNAACRAAAVLAVHTLMLDPHGARRGDAGDCMVPERVHRDHPFWQQVRPRFDGDRVFVHDTILLTVVGGSISGVVSMEQAWKVYKHDIMGLQVLADAIQEANVSCPILQPHLVVTEYMGFKVICTPDFVPLDAGPFNLVLGPLSEAGTAPGGATDLPDLWRAAANSRRREISMVLHDWEQRNPYLRADLQNIAKSVGCQGYPVVLDASDLPVGFFSTALLRVPGTEEIFFRTPMELMPPEVLSDTRPVDPVKRLRREALQLLGSPELPLSLRASGAVGRSNSWQAAGAILKTSLQAAQELPQRMLAHVSENGPPLDSQGWTDLFHKFGINMRHIGRVASVAPFDVRQSLLREALARAAKWLFRKALWGRKPWILLVSDARISSPAGMEPQAAEQIAQQEALRVFNGVLGSDEEAVRFWDDELVPETVRRFGVLASQLDRRKVLASPLYLAMGHHLQVRFQAACAQRPFFSTSLPRPFSSEDFARFTSSTMAEWFPHSQTLQERLTLMRCRLHGIEPSADAFKMMTRKFPLCGFFPLAEPICARGREWVVVNKRPQELMAMHRPDHAYDVLNMKLSMQRAIGDHCCKVGSTLQDIAVALLELSKPWGDREMSMGQVAQLAMLRAKTGTVTTSHDVNKLMQSIWAADLSIRRMPSMLSAWWAQLAALEAEWFVNQSVEARVRHHRMEAVWHKFAADQPVLLLRMESVLMRLAMDRSQWDVAATHAERSIAAAQSCFGGVHPHTVDMLTRLGDIHSRSDAWTKAIDAYRRGLAACKALTKREEMKEGQINFCLGRAMREKGDLAGAKPHAEMAVKILVPHFNDHSITGVRKGPVGPSGGPLALDALMLLGEVYEGIVLRASQCEESPLAQGMEQELVKRCIQSYEFFLKHTTTTQQAENGTKGKRYGQQSHELDPKVVRIVKHILRLRMQLLGSSEKPMLVDAVETLMISTGMEKEEKSAMEQRGVSALMARSQTRSVANAALGVNPHSKELAHKIDQLCEQIAQAQLVGRYTPTEWFDMTLANMSAGFSGHASPSEPSYQATLHMLDLFRYFGGKQRVADH
eukprot:TRINITY_DN7799_c0_g1_i1.p1 TRINITY_DN7799_c0_g1~~TRINITY_DN7799_c0_g1_i1.p1  ORF type:complete len:1188 (-),score=326.14 TRINITY_DN7799_c0_g1_i1:298-3861(-)